MRADGVVLKAIALGKAREIQPMPPPTFAVMRRGQQAIDQLFVSRWRSVVDEGVNLLRGGGQANEIKRHTPNQLFLGRPRRERKLIGFQRGDKRPVNGVENG